MTSDADHLLPEVRLALRLLSPSRADAIISYLDDRSERKRARLEKFADSAEIASGRSFEELLDSSSHSERHSDLAEEILGEASSTSQVWKMQALGRALASGLLADDDAALDEVQMLLSALKDLESPHVRVLLRLFTDGDRYRGVADFEIAAMFPNGVSLSYPLLKTLERHGLAGPLADDQIKGPDDAQVWAIWDFGILMIDRLLQEGTN